VGAIVTMIGLAFALIAMLPLVIPDLTLPSYWWFLAMTTGVGLALVLLGLRLSARARSRRPK
jgi:VIT1/CCC1 family predicted Fe2+/Mn2+ transporter